MATRSVGGTNVLTELEHRVPTSFLWSLTLLATLGGFLFGYDTSNIGSALNFVPYHLGGFAQGYLVAGASLGAAAGAIIAGPLTGRLGRKSLLAADAAIYALGALLSAFTPNAAVLVEVFPVWQAGIGLGWVLVCFAGLCILAILFVGKFLPETKGHSVEEIT
jgi:MFS transporter, SP family, arabinose:H+ symporter